jgi:hypothetical protein
MWPLIWPFPHVCCTTTTHERGFLLFGLYNSIPFSLLFLCVSVVSNIVISLSQLSARCGSDVQAMWTMKRVGRKARLFGYQ